MVEPYPSEKKIRVRQLGLLFPIYGKIKHVSNHQPAMNSHHNLPIHRCPNASGEGLENPFEEEVFGRGTSDKVALNTKIIYTIHVLGGKKNCSLHVWFNGQVFLCHVIICSWWFRTKCKHIKTTSPGISNQFTLEKIGKNSKTGLLFTTGVTHQRILFKKNTLDHPIGCV